MTGHEFYEWRYHRNLSQKDLASHLGVNVRTIRRVEEAAMIPNIYKYAIQGLDLEMKPDEPAADTKYELELDDNGACAMCGSRW